MATYVSLLRGINVGGHRKILMNDLRALYEELGFENVRSYIQSGNVVFEASAGKHGVAIQEGILERFGHEVPVMVIGARAFKEASAEHPLAKGAEPKQLYVAFFGKKPTAKGIADVEALDLRGDEILFVKKRAYVRYVKGASKTKLENHVLEKKLKTSSTMRNWRTVGKLGEMLA